MAANHNIELSSFVLPPPNDNASGVRRFGSTMPSARAGRCEEEEAVQWAPNADNEGLLARTVRRPT